MVEGLKGNLYKEQLRSLGLFSLEETERGTSLWSSTASRGEVDGCVQISSSHDQRQDQRK